MHISSTFSNDIFYRRHLNEAPTHLLWRGKQDFRASLSGIQPRNSGSVNSGARAARRFALIRRRTQMNCFSAGNRLSAPETLGGEERRTGRNRMSGSVADETGRSQPTARANWPRTTRANAPLIAPHPGKITKRDVTLFVYTCTIESHNSRS